MADPKTNWGGGANNKAEASRLPPGFVRALTNLDPLPGGSLELRTGYTQLVAGEAIRAMFSLGEQLVFVDGSDLKVLDLPTNTAHTVGSVAAAGVVAAAVLNHQLFISTATDSLMYDGALHPWAITPPAADVSVGAGALPAGIYKVGVTVRDASGAESGCDPYILTLTEGSSIIVTSPDPRPVRVYCSVANGATLFYQGGALEVSVVDDSLERLDTGWLRPFPRVDHLTAHHAVLVGAQGRFVYVSEPNHPHLWLPDRGFFQFPTPVTMIAAVAGGVYVAADKTYFITNPETDEPQQRVVLDFGAVDGTGVTHPDSTVSWFTAYGPAMGDAKGVVTLPTRMTYAPAISSLGAAGLLGHNGVQSVVTTMRGQERDNRMAAGDYYRARIIDER